MKFKQVAVLTGLIAVSGTALAQDTGLAPGVRAAENNGITDTLPRLKADKSPDGMLMLTSESTGRLSVKFADHLKVRAIDGQLVATGHASIDSVVSIFEQYGLHAESVFTNVSQDRLEALQNRAQSTSNRLQPDLGSMMYVYGDLETLERAAVDLNRSNLLEYVRFELKRYPGNDKGEGARGFVSVLDAPYVPPSGPVAGEGDGECDGCDDMEDAEVCGDCFVDGGNDTPYCTDPVCCEIMCTIDPFCCGDGGGIWDGICAEFANFICDNDDAMPCEFAANESCFIAHEGRGCLDADCCDAVCMVDGACCDDEWDEGCVELALSICTADPIDGLTPDYGHLQGYKTAAPYDGAPPELNLPLVDGELFFGYTGEGYNIFFEGEEYSDRNGNKWWDIGEEWDDANGDGVWDPPGGLWGFAEYLLRVEGVNANNKGNQIYGKGRKVAVIEWGYWEDHEDLDVITEPGQRLFQLALVDSPNHGTACLGIINAIDQGREGDDPYGVAGMVPDAEAWFFPLTSINEGPREFAAWFSALEEFGPGDVISASYGPAPQNLNTFQDSWNVFRLATDLGITVCVSAGNSCFNLEEAEDLGDSGAIVVGACTPGAPFYRLIFSNYGRSDDNTQGNRVHLKSWGSNVCTTGYGDLFVTEGAAGEGLVFDRSYTSGFGGTSAAAPIVAATVVMMHGFTNQFIGLSYTPELIRTALQTGDVIPPLPAPRLLGGFDENEVPCALDFISTEGPNYLGPLTDLEGSEGSAVTFLVQQASAGFTESPLVQNIAIIRGEHLAGNFFSIKGDDQLYLEIGAVPTPRDFEHQPGEGLGQPQGEGSISQPGFQIPETQGLHYLASGDIADVIAVAASNFGEQPTVFSTATQIRFPGVVMILVVEAFDWLSERWSFVGIDAVIPAPPGGEADPAEFTVFANASAPRRFVRDIDNRILVRVYSVGFPGFGDLSGPADYDLDIDLLNISVTEALGEQ